MSVCRRIESGLCALGLQDQTDQIPRFVQYLELIGKWNRVAGLTARSGLDDMTGLHLMDSLAISPFVTGRRILDAGSGAGLPGIPLALLMPDREFVLLDANGRKARFMTQAVIELGLRNVTVVQQRMEECEDIFDQIVSRAFAPLEVFIRLGQPRLAEGGSLLAMKGPSERALAGSLRRASVHELQVPGLDRERLLVRVG